MSHFTREEDQKRREIELLTDRELEVKIEVLESTLEELERSKDQLCPEELQSLKESYLAQQFTAQETLAKRKGDSKRIICPHCSSKTSAITKKCSHCGKDLPYCIVCLHSLGKGTNVRMCPHCKSLAHSQHFEDWLAKSSFCPYCKQKIEGKLEIALLETVKE